MITILFNIEIADARRIVKHKHRHSSKPLQERLVLIERSNNMHLKMNALKNKLPSGPSPGVGHAFINDGGVKTSSWRSSGNILRNKLPSGPSPGTGH